MCARALFSLVCSLAKRTHTLDAHSFGPFTTFARRRNTNTCTSTVAALLLMMLLIRVLCPHNEPRACRGTHQQRRTELWSAAASQKTPSNEHQRSRFVEISLKLPITWSRTFECAHTRAASANSRNSLCALRHEYFMYTYDYDDTYDDTYDDSLVLRAEAHRIRRVEL